jgi:hypothetical protein
MFHVEPYGETARRQMGWWILIVATEYEVGVLVGLLIGEGHFGGDSRQPQITLRMHVRHDTMFRWLERTFPAGRLYGPYDHGGRRYYQWMVRGPNLRELFPLLQARITPDLDAHAFERLDQMRIRYSVQLGFGLSSNEGAEIESGGAQGPPDPSKVDEIFSRLRNQDEA